MLRALNLNPTESDVKKTINEIDPQGGICIVNYVNRYVVHSVLVVCTMDVCLFACMCVYKKYHESCTQCIGLFEVISD